MMQNAERMALLEGRRRVDRRESAQLLAQCRDVLELAQRVAAEIKAAAEAQARAGPRCADRSQAV